MNFTDGILLNINLFFIFEAVDTSLLLLAAIFVYMIAAGMLIAQSHITTLVHSTVVTHPGHV
jgi:hypothetical protein